MLILYVIDSAGRAKFFQKISGSNTGFIGPQHAMFSRDGERILVLDWSGETFTIHPRLRDGSYASAPIVVIPFPQPLAGYKPHGMDVSPSGTFIAVTFGNSAIKPKAIAVFRYRNSTNRIELLSMVEQASLPGIPKGICFSPDETHLIVTFSDVNAICLYGFDSASGDIHHTAAQSLQAAGVGMNRAEEVRLTHENDQLIVSNSGNNSIAFYRFDGFRNRIVDAVPEHTIAQDQFGLEFPHGLAVSPDGCYLVASQFGPLQTTLDEDIVFGPTTPKRQAKLWILGRCGRGRPQRNWPWNRWLWALRDRVETRS
jgi:sugar lactone lactonase YvrE